MRQLVTFKFERETKITQLIKNNEKKKVARCSNTEKTKNNHIISSGCWNTIKGADVAGKAGRSKSNCCLIQQTQSHNLNLIPGY